MTEWAPPLRIHVLQATSGLQEFERVLDMMEQAVQGLLRDLLNERMTESFVVRHPSA